ncbi:MAG TPA: hypothetical protein VHX65_00105 [Pirellulales bacterium]|jgi:hypothetical protein|nr:hypothetical protein [Pirellulales bacterium]
MKAEKTEQSEREEKWGNSPDASDPYFMTFAKVEPEEKETGGRDADDACRASGARRYGLP